MPQRAKVPAAQAPSPVEQAVQRADPARLVYVPATHAWQVVPSVALSAVEYVPAEQSRQADATVGFA